MHTTTFEQPPVVVTHKFKVGDRVVDDRLDTLTITGVQLGTWWPNPQYTLVETAPNSVDRVDSNYKLVVVEPEPDYVPQKGDLVRYSTWPADRSPQTVTAVGEKYMILKSTRGDEGMFTLFQTSEDRWIKVEPETPLTETWTNRYPGGCPSSVSHSSLENANRLKGSGCIATTHEYGTVENPQIEVVWQE